VIGIFVMIVGIVVFGTITGDILGIFKRTDHGWLFNIPTLVPLRN
jgi:hypothetical protein